MTTEERIRKQVEALSRTVAKGRRHYVLIHGVLFWGLTMALIHNIAMATTLGWHVSRIVVSFLIYPLGGLFWASMMWRHLNRRLAKLTTLAA